MNEYNLIWQVTGAGMGILIGCLLYSLGGRRYKFLRRFVASFVIAVDINVLCLIRGLWQPLLLLIYPILIGTFCLGYSGDNFAEKFIKRFLCVAAGFMAGILLAYCLNAWWVLIPHAVVAFLTIYMGIKNPVYAAVEEFTICGLLTGFLTVYPFVVR